LSLSKFAADTAVPVERSQAEARAILNAHGCTKFALADEGDRSAIQAVLVKDGCAVSLRFVIGLPAKTDKAIATYKRGSWTHNRTPSAVDAAHAQECRRRWRCLVLLLKAKFAAVDSGIVLFQDEFLAHLVLPSGETVGTWAGREIAPAIAAGRMPTTLMLGTGA
jgi:hypothetical protein